MIRSIFGLTLALLTPWSQASAFGREIRDPQDLKIRAAYQDAGGRILVEFEEDPRTLPAGNTLFWGNEASLSQLEITWSDVTDDGERVISVSQGGSEARSSTILLSASRNQVDCQDRRLWLTPLPESAIRALRDRIRRQSIALHGLPAIEEPVYLFQVAGTDRLIYVTAPVFDFHRKFEVYLGTKRGLKKVASEEVPVDPTANQADLIRFGADEAIYVPASMDLFWPKGGTRGSPMLIGAGRMDALLRPRLTPDELKRLGVSRPRIPRLVTPCNER